ncbi:MAG: NAD(+) synthase [Akkermansia sp.]|nr:NAD(+) synthase [Akkermansia sp.]
MKTYGYYRLAAATPQVRVANVEFNVNALAETMKTAVDGGAAVVVFPELCITGASCGDLFFQPRLQQAAVQGLLRFAEETAGLDAVAVVGLPLPAEEALYNVAAVVKRGKVLGLVPASVLSCRSAVYASRHFRAAEELRADALALPGQGTVPFGTDLLFSDGADLCFGVEVGEDAESVIPPSSRLALLGARMILNPSSSPELVGSAAYRRRLVAGLSSRCVAAYVHSSAGVGESTQDFVCGGQAVIACHGRVLAENERFRRGNGVIYADVDLARLGNARLSEGSFSASRAQEMLPPARRISLGETDNRCDLQYAYLPSRPFVPDAEDFGTRCEDILNIQAAALAKRVEHSHAKTIVLGVSGGLDSTLALLVCARVCRMLGRDNSCILAVTMPGFGTTGRTYNNSVAMMQAMGVTFKEVNIREACLLHFRDLDFDPALRTNTYENVQARERTKILMNLANKTGGMVVGTGDLSEVALGWSTYNGDHMSMYGVNCSVPKTLIRCLLEHEARRSTPELAATLRDVIDTPVSPELLPPADDGTMEQKTEDILGPYDIHDFLLYHFIRYGAEPEKLRFLAQKAFAGEFDEALIERTLRMFITRFFRQQFKRSCVPDGPKVGTIALSPRGDWRMPSDACEDLWTSQLN